MVGLGVGGGLADVDAVGRTSAVTGGFRIGDAQVTGLSIEARQKLAKHQPETLGQASRISGITPAAISVLMVYAKRGFAGLRKSA